jgi:hypothetical protein
MANLISIAAKPGMCQAQIQLLQEIDRYGQLRESLWQLESLRYQTAQLAAIDIAEPKLPKPRYSSKVKGWKLPLPSLSWLAI